jgi:hypothetical protein
MKYKTRGGGPDNFLHTKIIYKVNTKVAIVVLANAEI